MFKKMLLTAALTVSTVAVATPAYAGNEVRIRDGRETVMNIGYSPVDSAVIPWDQDMESGNYTAVYAVMAPAMRVEWNPLAPVHPAMAIDSEGRIYRGYAMPIGFRDCSDLSRMTMIVLIKGIRTRTASHRVVILDRRVRGEAYGLDGSVLQSYDRGRFARDAAYRLDYIQQNGTPLAAGPLATRHMREREFPAWQQDNIRGIGPVRTPLTGQAYVEVLGRNPEYSLGQRLEANSVVAVDPLNLPATGIGLVVDFVTSAFAKSRGFDRRSVITNVEADARAQVLLEMQSDGVRMCRALGQL